MPRTRMAGSVYHEPRTSAFGYAPRRVAAQILPRFDFRADFAVARDKGSRRTSYEDAALVASEIGVFAVADGHVASNVIDLSVTSRRKTIDEDFEPKLIHTVRGAGYVLKDEPSAS